MSSYDQTGRYSQSLCAVRWLVVAGYHMCSRYGAPPLLLLQAPALLLLLLSSLTGLCLQ